MKEFHGSASLGLVSGNLNGRADLERPDFFQYSA